MNESPFTPSKVVLKNIAKAAQTSNRYPEWDSKSLRTALAAHMNVAPDWVVVGNGSMGVIQQTMIAAGPGEIVFCWPAFEAFETAAAALRMPVRRVELHDYACDLDAILHAITVQTSMIIVCTPNAPTGGIVSHQQFADFIEKVPPHIIVLLDEAYLEFVARELVLDSGFFVEKYANVIATRTFSKAYGLAGLRLGYGMAQPALARRVAAAGLPFLIPAPLQAAALQALGDKDALHEHVAHISRERQRMAAHLRELGAEVVEGYGNFVWLPLGKVADKVAQCLRDEGIWVKSVMPHGVRITVGTTDETDILCAAWQKSNISKEIL